MSINRRDFAIGASALGLAGALPRQAQAQAAALANLRSGKPFAGQEIKILCVVATQFRAHEARAAAFTEATGITVKYTYVPFANMREALTAEMVGGTGGFDIVVVMDQWVPSLVNLMDPMDARITAKKIDTARYPKAFLDLGAVDGKQLGLPTRSHVQLLFYRKDLFAKHNLAAPKTWDEVVSISKVLQDKEQISGIALPYGKSNGQNLMVWYNFLWGRGADVFDAKGMPLFASEAGLRATQDYIDMLRTHKVTPAAAVSFNEQDAVNSMRGGNSAMVAVWWWVRGGLIDPKVSKLTEDQVGFTPLPSFAGGPRSTYINNWIYGIARNSKAKDAAMEFVTFVTEPSLERDILLDPKESDVIATQWSNLRDPEVNKRFGGMHTFAAEALQNTKVVPYTADWPQMMEAMETAMSEAASGTRSVSDAFKAAEATVRRIARRG
ncbi:MAG: ABC transporter substrate-binding protein [Bosea sp. (in: a-proteobacteria)]|jgi:multiple sugar transport system substrate-binding protein